MAKSSKKKAYSKEVDGIKTEAPKLDGIDQKSFWGQRHQHRDRLCTFAIRITWASFIFFIALVVAQGVARVIISPNFQIVSDVGLDIIAVSVFGEAIGVVALIATSLWDGKEFGVAKDKGE